MPGLAELPYSRLANVPEDGRIVPGALSLPPTSHGDKNEDTTQKGGVSDFYGELSDDCKLMRLCGTMLLEPSQEGT